MTRSDPLIWLPNEGPLLDFYRGTFDAVYVALHPFFRISGLNPLRCQYGSVVLQRSEMPEGVGLLDYMKQLDAERSLNLPIAEGEVDERAKREGVIVPWREVGSHCGLDDARAINRALRTIILGLRPEFADEAGADRLAYYCAREQIFRPTESEFQPVSEHRLVELFARAGCARVVLGDEFGDHDISQPLDFLKGDVAWIERPDWPQIHGVRRIYAEDRSMLAIEPWDQFFTVVAMTVERARQAAVDELFEGFWCDETTSLGSMFEPPRPLLGPSR
jgi:hypothetical protein